MRWISDRVASEMMTALGLTTPEAAQEALTNAEKVWGYVATHEWIDESDLRTWGETQGLAPDEMTVALQLLQISRRAWSIDVAAPVAPPMAGGPFGAPPGGLHDYNKDELQEQAKAKGLTGYSSMTKQELVDALERAG